MSARPTRYDAVAMALHWAMALLIILMLPLGFFLEAVRKAGFDGYTLHKSVGITLLALMLFRLIWRLLGPVPALPQGMRAGERLLAHASHTLLYVLMFLIPATGWIMVSASAKYPLDYFWLGELPFLPMPELADPQATAHWWDNLHQWLAIGLIALLVLHISAAIYHHRVRRDDVLTRMLP